jgi:DNA-directed RNA polymerase subunit RPC12/RpoP
MSSEISYTCPHCGGEMTFSEEYGGMESKCPHCQQTITLGEPIPQEIQRHKIVPFSKMPLTKSPMVDKSVCEMTQREATEYQAWKRQLKPNAPDAKFQEMLNKTDAAAVVQQHQQFAANSLSSIHETELAVKGFFEQKFGNDPECRNVLQVNSVTLTHIQGNKYQGTITIQGRGEIGTSNIEVTYDGQNISIQNITDLQTHNTPMKQMLLIFIFAILIALLFYQISLVLKAPTPLNFGGLAFGIACCIANLITLVKKL